MKYSLYMTALVAGGLLASCADEFDQDYKVAMPKSLADYAYLADYKPLKEYVTNPNFKLGGALEAGDYNNGGAMALIANTNFHEIVAGNAMKMASCVDENGNMNFSTVQDFVSNAEAAGISVFGHTLAWHAQQPKKWLENVVLADKPVEINPNAEPTESIVKTIDLTTYAGTATHTVSQGEAGEGKEGITDSYGEMHLVGTQVDFPNYIMGYIPKMTNEGLESKNPGEGAWYQYFVATGIPADGKETTKYRVKFTVKAEGDCNVDAVMRWSWSEDPVKVSLSFSQSSDFVEVTKDFEGIKGTSFDIVFQTSATPTFIVKKVEVYELEMPSTELSYWENVITNSDCEGTEGGAFYIKNAGESNGTPASKFVDGGNPGKCVSVTSATRNPTGEKDDNGNDVYEGQDWDAQFWIVFPEAYQEGTTFKIAFDYKADQKATGGTQAHGEPGAYHHWSFIGDVNFTTEWQHFEKTVTLDKDQAKDGGCKSCAFNLSITKTATKYFFDNIEVSFERSLNGAAQTPEEKKDTLTWALDRWIGGMMAACGGKVKAWDVVNEAVSGADKDGDGDYDLQHADAANADNGVSPDFFWQDYLGDIDYVRIAVASARKHFVANGGAAADLKLFINDYNLESTWDDNKKLKSLINWIAKWEADGTTKIDGIGSQMHVIFSAKAEKQKKQEECVENMLKLMAATGKLVRISELDMGYEDDKGIILETEELTEEQHKQMAAYYNFIVRKYLEIVPADQQYGITQWCLTDSPASSSWRTNWPTGLWDLNYNRKHTYAGFAEGLQGKEYSK